MHGRSRSPEGGGIGNRRILSSSTTSAYSSSAPTLPPRPPVPAPASSSRSPSAVGAAPPRFNHFNVAPAVAAAVQYCHTTGRSVGPLTLKETTPLKRSNSTSCLRGGASSRTPTPKAKRDASGASEEACVLGVGAGGVVELSQHLQDWMVSWALLRFQVGGGTFSRTKLVAIHFNGEETPVMLRGWLKARGSEFSAVIGEVHANIEVMRTSELTVEHLCERLLPLFVADNMNYSLRSLEQEYGRIIAQMEEEASRKRLEAAAAERNTSKEPATVAALTAEEALSAVAADHGKCNWVLMEARSLKLHRAGHGGLDELKANLVQDRVLFGTVRFMFGCSARSGNTAKAGLGITKHIFVHWVGPRVGAVQRGLQNAKLAGALAKVSKCCAVTFRREAHGLEDLELEDIVAELRRLTDVDGVASADGVASCRISSAEYLAALREELREREKRPSAASAAEVQPSTPSKIPEPQMPDLRKAVESVRAPSGEWNWVLYGCRQRRPVKGGATSDIPKLQLPKSPARGGG